MTAPAAELAKTRDVSVIITSNLDDRLEWLKHRLNFLYGHGHQGEVIVGVWSGHDKIPALRSFCAPLSSKIHVIAQERSARFTARALAMAEQTAGKYIMQIGDDDFLLPAALDRLATYLECDPSAFCAQGRTIQINNDLSEFGVFMFPMWPAPETDPLTRYTQYLKHPGQMFHAMFRRPDGVERLRWMDETMAYTNNHIWFEFTAEFFALIKGRFVILEDVFLLRGKHVGNTSRLLLRDASDEMFPYHLFSQAFSAQYKFVEEQVFRLFASVGVDGTRPQTRKIILDGMLDLFGAVLYGRKGPPPQEEADLMAIFMQRPPHPLFLRIIQMVNDTKL